MRTTKGQSESSIVQLLIDEPHRFEFMQAIRLLLVFLKRHGISSERALAQVLRFESRTSLHFPASEIERLCAGAQIAARTDTMLVLAATQQASQLRIRITPAFIGFLGSSGMLPFHYSERIAAHQQQERGEGAQAFVGVLSNRLVGQFYLAWEKYRIEHSTETRRRDLQLPILLSLAGVPRSAAETVAMDRPDTPGDHALAFYAALFRTRPASAFAIARALTEYFGVPIRLEEWVGAWDPIPEKIRVRLGRHGPRLGFGASLGTRQWNHGRRIRLHVGPLTENGLDRFLPRTPGARAIATMLTLFDVGRVEAEVRLVLGQDCVRPLTLTTRDAPAAGRLGWTTFLTTGAKQLAEPEVRYLLNME